MEKPKTIVLIACAATKLPQPAPAEKLYDSPLFKKSLAYAHTLNPTAIYILSAKHYVVPLKKTLAPYDMTLLDMKADEVKAWSNVIIKQLSTKYSMQNDNFIFLAGEKYRKYVVPQMTHTSAPTKGLRIGEQLQWYTRKLAKKITEAIKKLFIFKKK